MKTAQRILIIDGNTSLVNEATTRAGGIPTGEGYEAVLSSLAPNAECTIVRPADEGANCLPAGAAFYDFDGYVISGSALNAYSDAPEVTAQTTLAREAFESGIPGFGSCWGLQIMSVALGGTVRLNPKGREVPFGRAITPNDAGAIHPLFAGRPDSFDTVAIHMDEVSELPEGSTLLASNGMSRVQAVEIRRGRSTFWGVQYHPEFSLLEMAAILQRNREPLVAEGLYGSGTEVDAFSADLLALHQSPEDPARYRLKLNDIVIGFDQRTLEIRNWLETLVAPKTEG